jgi:hypothetical protein
MPSFAILVLCRVYLMIQMQLVRPIFKLEHSLTLWHLSFFETLLTVDVLDIPTLFTRSIILIAANRILIPKDQLCTDH